MPLPMGRRTPGRPPMTLGNMREQGVHHLSLSASTTRADIKRSSTFRAIRQIPPLPWFRTKVKCAKCGARENNKFSARKPEKSSIRPPLFLAILGCQGGEPEVDVCEIRKRATRAQFSFAQEGDPVMKAWSFMVCCSPP